MPLSTPYLAALAEGLYATHKEQVDGLTLVFPTTKAAYHFRKYLGKLIGKPHWAPSSYLLPAFLQTLYPKAIPSRLVLLGHLYRVAQTRQQTKVSFAHYYGWGNMFLDLLEEMAQYDVSEKVLFASGEVEGLTATQQATIKAFWATIEHPPREMQVAFLAYWKELPELHRAFHAHLHTHNIAYQGLHCQQVHEHLLTQPKLEHRHVILVGIQPLTPIVQKILTRLHTAIPIDLHYDVDGYYMEPSGHEAGRYLRTYAADPLLGKHLKEPFSQQIASQKTQVTLIGSATQVGQVEVVAQRLRSLMEKTDFQVQETAILLADAALLLPLLHALPPGLPIALHMDYPLYHTPIYTLLMTLLHLHTGEVQQVGGATVNHDSLKLLLHHPYLGPSEVVAQQVIAVCGSHAARGQGIADLPELWQYLLTPPSPALHVWDYLIAFLERLLKEATSLELWEHTSMVKGIAICKMLGNIPLQTPPHKVDMEVIHLFEQHMQQASFRLEKPHAQGVHLMHFNDADYLDFRRVFVLSMNEGNLSTPSPSNSLIPQQLRAGYGLPTRADGHVSYAYRFYRLLHRTQQLYVIYHKGTTAGKISELSRYVRQLHYEAHWPMTECSHVVPSAGKLLTVPIVVHKNSTIQTKLARFTSTLPDGKPLTPSALNTYLDCSLRFYFQHIANLAVPLPPVPLIHSANFGQLFHQAMEQLYAPCLGERITKETLCLLRTKVAGTVTHVLTKQHTQQSLSYPVGAKGIIGSILMRMVHKVLDVDAQKVPFMLVALEMGRKKKLVRTLTLPNGQMVRLGGIIDRIDSRGGEYRVLDYKIGVFHPYITGIQRLFDRNQHTRNNIGLQLLWYAWLYTPHTAPGDVITPTIMSMRSLFEKRTILQLSLRDANATYQVLTDAVPYNRDFEAGLRPVLTELLDPEIPFVQTADCTTCILCPYNKLCQR